MSCPSGRNVEKTPQFKVWDMAKGEISDNTLFIPRHILKNAVIEVLQAGFKWAKQVCSIITIGNTQWAVIGNATEV